MSVEAGVGSRTAQTVASAQLSAMQARSDGLPREWEAPVGYDIETDEGARGVGDLIIASPRLTVVDNIGSIAGELVEVRNPELKADPEAKADAVRDFVQGAGNEYGTWFHLPWRGELVRYPTKEDHVLLRTARNNPLRTPEEQGVLRGATVGVAGLSVGSNVALEVVKEGIGDTIILADTDVVDPTNFNRVEATMRDAGLSKIDLVARAVSEIDPYVTQIHYRQGVNAENLAEIMSGCMPDVFFEEIDNLPIKFEVREAASEGGVAVVMVTDAGERTVLDIERYDLDPQTKPFDGRVDDQTIARLKAGQLPPEEMGQVMAAMAGGMPNISPRLMQGLQMNQQRKIPGLPQLGSTARLGAAVGAKTAAAIILGRDVPSGQTVIEAPYHPGN